MTQTPNEIATQDTDGGGNPVFPAYYVSADQAAFTSQRLYFGLVLADTILLLVVNLCSSLVAVPPPFGDIAKYTSLVLSVCSLLLFWAVPTPKHRKAWSNQRSVAETIKSITWQFAMTVPPYGTDDKEPTAREAFVERIDLAVASASPNSILTTQKSADTREVTAWALRMRTQSAEHRLQAYLTYRLDDQIDWYSRRARSASTNAKRFRVLVITLQLLTVFIAFGTATGYTGDSLDFTGFFAAASVAAFSWLQGKQYDELMVAYADTERDLRKMKEKTLGRLQDGPVPDDLMIEETVRYCESAISKEHSMWYLANTGRLEMN